MSTVMEGVEAGSIALYWEGTWGGVGAENSSMGPTWSLAA